MKQDGTAMAAAGKREKLARQEEQAEARKYLEQGLRAVNFRNFASLPFIHTSSVDGTTYFVI